MDLKANLTQHLVILQEGTVEPVVPVPVVACQMAPHPAVKMLLNLNSQWVSTKLTKKNLMSPNIGKYCFLLDHNFSLFWVWVLIEFVFNNF